LVPKPQLAATVANLSHGNTAYVIDQFYLILNSYFILLYSNYSYRQHCNVVWKRSTTSALYIF